MHLRWLQSLIQLQGHGAVFSHILWSVASLFLFHGTVMKASVGTAVLTSPIKRNWARAKGIDRWFQKPLLEEAHLLLDLPTFVFCGAPQGGGAAPFHASFFLALYQRREENIEGQHNAVCIDTVKVWCRINSACPSPWFEWMRGVAANPFYWGDHHPSAIRTQTGGCLVLQ